MGIREKPNLEHDATPDPFNTPTIATSPKDPARDKCWSLLSVIFAGLFMSTIVDQNTLASLGPLGIGVQQISQSTIVLPHEQANSHTGGCSGLTPICLFARTDSISALPPTTSRKHDVGMSIGGSITDIQLY